MNRARRHSLAALAASGLLLLAACGGDDDPTTATTAGGGGEETTDTATEETGTDATATTAAGGGEEGAFAVDAADCPEDVTAPIEGTVSIGATMPLSGGAAAAAFAPVADGLRNYIAFANENELVPGVTLELTIEDDQFNPTLTTPAVEGLIDNTGVNLFTGMIGTGNNQAVRDLLNGECYPQLFALTGAPIWGDVENYPWTTGGLPPYNTETAVYVDNIAAEFPDGATASVFHVNSEFGQSYADALEGLAPDAGIEILGTQTVENGDNNPPTSQVNAIAAQTPDVILAVPLGAQCPAFLTEVANAKAANPGWEPRIYITSTCASTLLLAISGAAADGIFTIVTAKDANDPANASDPDISAYRDAMTAAGFAADGDFATAAAGWVTGELTVETLRLAAESPDGLTRASILNAARSIDFHATLFREGLNYTMGGAEDPFGLESMQVVQYDADTKTYTDIGELITSFEGQTEFTE
ncbi:MAG: ABC transporter substrate-binding protein [Actinomycetota bacterium]|nr:ABC transporter substrate-binding protein [Actinomycetota bacterium]